MERIIGCFTLMFSLAVFSSAFADDLFLEGQDAARSGDYQTAFEKWKPLVIEGNGAAMFDLALMYHAGLHVQQNEAIAVQLYHMAAEAGNPMAQEYLSAGYENGWYGLPKSDELAAYWLGKSEQAREEFPVYARGNTGLKSEKLAEIAH